MNPDIALNDREEPVRLMEPLLLPEGSRRRGELTDLVFELVSTSTGLRKSLPEGVAEALADLVRSMNCYYSNLIEGHDTHPVDIERALNDDYSSDPRKRNLQMEAKAHITVQEWIDRGGLTGKAVGAGAALEIHRRFGELLPEDLLWVENPETNDRLRMAPGELRRQDVRVGRQVAISPGAIPRFLDRFEHVYGRLGKTETILAVAAAHHRLLWIHPFLDGNGRVARLMSYAILLETLDTGGVWSIARGLARNELEYKRALAACDAERRNDLDGRGNLSQAALEEFTHFFLRTCIDQVRFMESLVRPDRLRDRILTWVDEEVRAGALPHRSENVLEAILYRGRLPRGDVGGLLGSTDRHARRITSALLDRKVLVSDSTRAPLRLAIPAELASRWMPGLFPDNLQPPTSTDLTPDTGHPEPT